MDALSRFLQWLRPEGTLELRCQFEGGYAVEHPPQPRRDEADFHLLLAGHCAIDTEAGTTLTLQAGDFVLFPRGGAHRLHDGRGARPQPLVLGHDGLLPLRRTGSGPAEVDLLCGRIRCAPGRAVLLQSLPDPLQVSLGASPSQPALATLIALMRDEAQRRAPGALAIVTALSQALFALALRAHAEQRPDLPGLLPLLGDARLGPSVRAMLAEPEKPWTLAELASLAALSRASYARHFDARAGMTVGALLAAVRMARAGELLLNSSRSAAEIGAAVGYQSEAAFGKAFKQHTGLPPGRWRRASLAEAAGAG